MLGVSIFSSCSKEECSTCAYNFAWDAGEDYEAEDWEEDAKDAVMETFADMASGELCDDDLTAAEDAFAALEDDEKGGDESTIDHDDDAATADVTVGKWAVTMDCEAKE